MLWLSGMMASSLSGLPEGVPFMVSTDITLLFINLAEKNFCAMDRYMHTHAHLVPWIQLAGQLARDSQEMAGENNLREVIAIDCLT